MTVLMEGSKFRDGGPSKLDGCLLQDLYVLLLDPWPYTLEKGKSFSQSSHPHSSLADRRNHRPTRAAAGTTVTLAGTKGRIPQIGLGRTHGGSCGGSLQAAEPYRRGEASGARLSDRRTRARARRGRCQAYRATCQGKQWPRSHLRSFCRPGIRPISEVAAIARVGECRGAHTCLRRRHPDARSQVVSAQHAEALGTYLRGNGGGGTSLLS